MTEVIFDAEFNFSGRFDADATDSLGKSHSVVLSEGGRIEIRCGMGVCSLGSILVATSATAIVAILLGDDQEGLVHDLEGRFPNANRIVGDNAFDDVMAKVIGFIEAPEVGFDLPLDMRGTAFQHRVWQALQEISVGSTATYTEIAQKIGMPKAVRAVAAACAANTIAVAIPCHRVVRNDGSLSGYRWGVARKRKLIVRELQAEVMS